NPAVITIQGLCNKPHAENKTTKAEAAPCETTISRSEFEAVVNAIQPEMPESARKQFASRYAMGMVLAHDAHEQGLDRGPAFDEMMKLMRIQVMAQELAKNLRKEAGQISDADVKAYYDKNSDKYQEAAKRCLRDGWNEGCVSLHQAHQGAGSLFSSRSALHFRAEARCRL